MTSQTESDVTSRFVDHGFPISVQYNVSSLLYYVHKLYAFFERSMMAVCRFRPLGGVANLEVKSPFDSSTTVSSWCSIFTTRLACTV
jgi:hypothetical protein